MSTKVCRGKRLRLENKKRVGTGDYSSISNSFAFVGVTRLELATSRPPDAYSNQLSYTPIRSNQTIYRCRLAFAGLSLLTYRLRFAGASGSGLISKSDAKVRTIFLPCKFFGHFFQNNCNFASQTGLRPVARPLTRPVGGSAIDSVQILTYLKIHLI